MGEWKDDGHYSDQDDPGKRDWGRKDALFNQYGPAPISTPHE